MTAEHIYPLSRLVLLPGFTGLPPKLRLEIAHDVNEIIPFLRSTNSSRSATPYSQWRGWEKLTTDPSRRAEIAARVKELAAREARLTLIIEERVRAAVAKFAASKRK